MSNSNHSFSEDFIHFVWKFRLFEMNNLLTVSSEKIEILHPGIHSLESGPDFTNAKIKIGETLWAGNVEIHHSNKDWYLHKHENDLAYNNVVLHVVFSDGELPITTQNGRIVPTLVLGDRIFPGTLQKYKLMMESKPSFIPCEQLIQPNESILHSQFYESLALERLGRKLQEIEHDLEFTKGSLDDAFLISLFKYFGAPANKDSFATLARSFSLHQLIKQATSVKQIEALLFGLSGLLDASDDYAIKLENEFEYLKSLYKFPAVLNSGSWKFSTVRPPNFPTVRIAQLSALLFHEQRLLNYILEENDSAQIRKKFKIAASEYWNTHYVFGKTTASSVKKMSDAFIDKLMINVIAPFLFFYGNYKLDENIKEKAIDLLIQTEAEKNSLVQKMHQLGFSAANAMDTQALIQLKTSYCTDKKCLQCRIGYSILKK
jgi:hypothetical protein